jgi:hypothetical protein
MSLVAAGILVLGGVVWLQARRIGKLREQNAFLLDLADRAITHGVLVEARYTVAQERIDGILGYRRGDYAGDYEGDYEEDPRKTQAYADLLSL